MIYLTSDLHFGHENMVKNYGRTMFKNARQMDRVLVTNWNETVSDDDDVYIIGDFTLMKPRESQQIEQIVRKLKGTKHLILGNHDELKPFSYNKIGFKSVHTSLEIEKYTLVHDPCHSIQDRNKVFLCGHVHDLFSEQKNCINVGVDVRDFKPISLDAVKKISYNMRMYGKTNSPL